MWREYYRRWRAIATVPAQGEETASNVPVPFIRWNIFAKWAKEMDSLFGDDAEVVAVPVGPSDYRKDKKISRYMTWRVFNSMKLLNPFCEFVLRKLIFGKSIAYAPWKRETFRLKGQEVVDYEGPAFEPQWPDDIIVPAEEVKTIHEFSWVIRRYRITPDGLLEGEEKGRYQGITKNWEKIIRFAQHGTQREWEGEEIKQEKDDAEGIVYQRPLSSGEWITVLEYYGKWRPLKKGKKDASEWDFDRREMRTQEYRISYLWDLHVIIGLQLLEDLIHEEEPQAVRGIVHAQGRHVLVPGHERDAHRPRRRAEDQPQPGKRGRAARDEPADGLPAGIGRHARHDPYRARALPSPSTTPRPTWFRSRSARTSKRPRGKNR